MAIQVGPRIRLGLIPLAALDPLARPGGRTVVLHLAAQCFRQVPHPQAARAGAMANGVSRQFVHDQDHVDGPVLQHPGLTGVRLHGRTQRVQRAGIEH